jgi:predicted RNA binding protein YcfA (HicA-like mRNA interferase family)
VTPRGCEPRLWRDVVARFYQLGGRPLRTRGSHQTWLLPRNERFTVVCNHLGDAVPKRILAQLRKLLARLSPDEAEPPLPPPCSGHGDPVEASGVFPTKRHLHEQEQQWEHGWQGWRRQLRRWQGWRRQLRRWQGRWQLAERDGESLWRRPGQRAALEVGSPHGRGAPGAVGRAPTLSVRCRIPATIHGDGGRDGASARADEGRARGYARVGVLRRSPEGARPAPGAILRSCRAPGDRKRPGPPARLALPRLVVRGNLPLCASW